MQKTYKMFLDTDLDGQPKIGDSLLFAGRNSVFNSTIFKRDLYKNALSKYMIGSNLNKKIACLINIINKRGHNIEMIQKSSKGQDFNNFIKTDQKTKGKTDIPNVAIIIRVGAIEKSIVPTNAVILTISFERDFKLVHGILQPHISEKLSSIQLVKLPENRYGHGSVVSLDKVEIITEFKQQETQLKERDFSSILGLKKAFDMYGNRKSKIQLKEQSHFIQKFSNFLKAKEDNKLTPYFISDEEILKLEENKEYSFTTMHKKTQIIENKDRFYIGSNKDYSSKVGVVVRKVKKLQFSDFINNQITEEENHQSRIGDMINKSIQKIKDQKNVLKKLEKEKEVKIIDIEETNGELSKVSKRQSHILKVFLDAKKELEKLENHSADTKKDFNVVSKDHADVESKISQLKNTLDKKTKKMVEILLDEKTKEECQKNFDIYLSSWKKEMKSYARQEIELKEKINNLTRELSKNEENLESANLLLKEHEEKYSSIKNVKQEITNLISGKESELKLIGKSLKNIMVDIKSSESGILEDQKKFKNIDKNILTLEANLDKFIEDDLELVELKISVISNSREKSLKSTLSIEASTLKDIAFRNRKDSYFSDYDAGLNMKFKRFLYTIRAYESGSYKSPYAALSLEKPDVSIESKNDAKSSPSIKLNKLQQQALNATANSHFASFLQGPPGTGKTQVIASAIENEIANGGNVLISSSTNAAINNAMERMNRTKSNPNIFFLRHSNNIDKIQEAKDFTSQMLYPNFIERLDGFVKENSLAEEIDFSPIESLAKERFTKKYVPAEYFEKYISQITTIKGMEYFLERFEGNGIEDVTLAKTELKEIFEYNRRTSMKAKAQRLDDYISIHKNKVAFEKEDDFNSYLEKLKKYSNSNLSGGEFNRRLNNLSKRSLPKELFEKKSKEFADTLFNNSYINVIGITTTSKLSIKQTGRKKERELFVDYPINFAIIDEISKSVTPEILSVAKLADRFMFAGDYRQLPPASEISPKLIEEFRQYCIRNARDGVIVDKTIASFGLNSEKGFAKSIEDLLAISLFTNQVNDMKRSKKEKTSYTALKMQYRFNSVINELVNLTYDSNESLTPGKEDSTFKKYETGIKNLSFSPVLIVDTSFISQDYADRLNSNKVVKEPINAGQESFDHNDELFYKRPPYNSKVNGFNSHVVTRIVENLKIRNQASFDPTKIGIIAMTRSQSQVIKKELSNYEGTKSFGPLIKVDTVDNFQGQEKDIIILDLVRAKGQLSGGKIIYGNRNLDFYKKPERINVAVSRAQSKLIIVGAVNDYLAPQVISDVFINGGLESLNLFEDWKDIVDSRGENTSWEKY